MTTGSEFPGPP